MHGPRTGVPHSFPISTGPARNPRSELPLPLSRLITGGQVYAENRMKKFKQRQGGVGLNLSVTGHQNRVRQLGTVLVHGGEAPPCYGVRPNGPSSWGSLPAASVALRLAGPPPHRVCPHVFVFTHRCSTNVCPVKTKLTLLFLQEHSKTSVKCYWQNFGRLGVEECTARFQKMLRKGGAHPCSRSRRKQGCESTALAWDLDVHPQAGKAISEPQTLHTAWRLP